MTNKVIPSTACKCPIISAIAIPRLSPLSTPQNPIVEGFSVHASPCLESECRLWDGVNEDCFIKVILWHMRRLGDAQETIGSRLGDIIDYLKRKEQKQHADR